jgi:hypothetical protein
MSSKGGKISLLSRSAYAVLTEKQAAGDGIHKPYVNMDYDIRFNFSMVDMNQTTTELQLVLDNNLNLRHKRIPSCH